MNLIERKNAKGISTKKGNKKLYLSVRDAAAYSGLSEYIIRKLIAEQKVPYVKTGVKYLIDRVALKNYLSNKSRRHLSL